MHPFVPSGGGHGSPHWEPVPPRRQINGGWGSPEERRVELAFPNVDQFSMLARMTGAALAGSAGFSVAEIDRLRHALDAVWAVLHASLAQDDVMHLGFGAAPRSLRLQGGGRSSSGLPLAGDSGPIHLDIVWHAEGAA